MFNHCVLYATITNQQMSAKLVILGEWLSQHFEALLTFVGGSLLGVITSARKRKAETAKLIHDNEQNIILMYRQTLDDMNERFQQEIASLRKEIQRLESELAEYKAKLDKYEN